MNQSLRRLRFVKSLFNRVLSVLICWHTMQLDSVSLRLVSNWYKFPKKPGIHKRIQTDGQPNLITPHWTMPIPFTKFSKNVLIIVWVIQLTNKQQTDEPNYPTCVNVGVGNKLCKAKIPLCRLSPKLPCEESYRHISWKSPTLTNHEIMKFRWKTRTKITIVADTNHLDMSRCLRQSPWQVRDKDFVTDTNHESRRHDLGRRLEICLRLLACLAGVMVRCVHLCQVTGVIPYGRWRSVVPR